MQQSTLSEVILQVQQGKVMFAGGVPGIGKTQLGCVLLLHAADGVAAAEAGLQY